MGKTWQVLPPIQSHSSNNVICVVSDHIDKLFCNSPVAHKLSCKDLSCVGIINVKHVDDRGMDFSTALQEVTSDSNIPSSDSGNPQVRRQYGEILHECAAVFSWSHIAFTPIKYIQYMKNHNSTHSLTLTPITLYLLY